MTRRPGRFKVDRAMFDQAPGAVTRVMGACIVVRAEFVGLGDEIEYLAFSNHFDEVAPGQPIPMYVWTVHAGEPDGPDISARRVGAAVPQVAG